MYHDCKATGCGRRIPTSQLMCREHWFMVPKPLRDRVNAAWWLTPDWRALENPEYMAARQEAIDAVAAKLRPSSGNVSGSFQDCSQNPRDARGGGL